MSRKGERRYAYRWGLKHFLWMNDRLPQGPWLQQDLGITLSASMGMIGVLEITLIVPTLRAHRYTQVIWPSIETAALPCFFAR
ncbi:hypothetical protein AO390_10615 [Pseudomonas marginalis ICMP 11289]|nr:hypothetical protein AO390_10615 [Pseudomonas marginalis ICMP 11289]